MSATPIPCLNLLILRDPNRDRVVRRRMIRGRMIRVRPRKGGRQAPPPGRRPRRRETGSEVEIRPGGLLACLPLARGRKQFHLRKEAQLLISADQVFSISLTTLSGIGM